MVLKGLEGGERGTAGEELVGELGLVTAVLQLVVVFLGVACGGKPVSYRRLAGEVIVGRVTELQEELMPRTNA